MASLSLRQSASALPGFVPRLIGSLQNIPPIKLRIPFGFLPQQPQQDHQSSQSPQQRDLATPNDSFIPPAGIAVLPTPTAEDNGLVLAVPKKKVSHQKKRQRQLAGDKQLKELKSLHRCPSCGHVKRMHTLCMNCVNEVRQVFKERDQLSAGKSEQYVEELSKDDERVIYPGKRLSDEEKKLREKEYLYRPPHSLPYEKRK
ncbi:hypothetical protein D0Z00_002978 [Geotrichum galactomycetum]|uniref:Uncharacterized protein n=1 Tax=Geotrichum galactomycetum TaxID=27317 RepID=A0ACB6V2J9_9ASCO|nr:hypothetical protein D0Z00_002978 [Geotrichum candidum]